MKKSDLEKHLGRKLTKEEFKIELEKFYEKWTEAIGDLDDEKNYTGEIVEDEVYRDDYTTVFYIHDAGEVIPPDELASLLSEYEQMRIDENFKLQRKEVIYIE